MKKLLSIFAIFCICMAAKPQNSSFFTNINNYPAVKATYGYQRKCEITTCYKPSDYPPYPLAGEDEYPRYLAPFVQEGIAPGRHELITTQGTDPNTGDALYFLPPGEASVVKLGNDWVNYECEALTYTFIPVIENPILLINFAVVLSDPEHYFLYQPRFILRIVDNSGNLVEDCSEYDVTSKAGIPGFQDYMFWEEKYRDWLIVHWRDWTYLSVDLYKYVGQEVQVQFITYDCNQGLHYGYCYFTAKCVPNTLLVDVCGNDSFTLEAPEYFDYYVWSDGQTGRTATFNTIEVLDSHITCTVTSALGCECTLSSYITTEPQNTVTEYIYETICEGDTYSDNYFNLPPQQLGVHSYQLALIDPILCIVYVKNLELTVIERYTRFKAAICHEEEFSDYALWPKIPQYPTPGVWRDTVKTGTSGQCDTYDVMELVVNVNMETLTIQGDPSPCVGDLVTYSFLGSETLTSYWWTFPTNAEVISGSYFSQVTLCFTNANDTVIKLLGENGCGSGSISLNISPRPSYNNVLSEQVCQGEVYSKNGFNLGVQNEVGYFVHTKHLQSSQGCDSTVTLSLNVLPVPVVSITASDTALCVQGEEVALMAVIGDEEIPGSSACPGSFPSAFFYNCGYSYEWSTGSTAGGVTVTPSPPTSTYTVTVTSDIGCKVTASQTISVYIGDAYPIYDTICFGEPYYKYNLVQPNLPPGDYKLDTWIDGDNCVLYPSVYLHVYPEAKFEIIETLCSGDTYSDHGFNFQMYGDGTYIDTMHFISKAGCDSLVIFNFTIKPQKETFIYDNICQFETYNKNGLNFGAQNFSGLQMYTKTLIGSNGCDSTVILRLNVYPTPVNVVDFGIVLGLAGNTTTFTNWSIYYDESIIAGWEWYLDDAPYPFATTKDASYIFAEAGNHKITLKVKSINGCWDDISKNITIDPCPLPNLIVNKTSEIVCGLETVTITGSFENADKISIQTLNSNGKKAQLIVTGNTFTVTYNPTIANIGKTPPIQIIITATDSSTTCPGATKSVSITVKHKPKVRTKGECIEEEGR